MICLAMSLKWCRYGIAFFGTPHKGGNKASHGKTVASMFRRVLRNPRNDFLEVLQKQSYVTAELSEAFRGDLERYYFLSFFETTHMPIFGLVCLLIAKRRSQCR